MSNKFPAIWTVLLSSVIACAFPPSGFSQNFDPPETDWLTLNFMSLSMRDEDVLATFSVENSTEFPVEVSARDDDTRNGRESDFQLIGDGGWSCLAGNRSSLPTYGYGSRRLEPGARILVQIRFIDCDPLPTDQIYSVSGTVIIDMGESRRPQAAAFWDISAGRGEQ